MFRRIRFQNHVTEDRLGVKGAREAIRRRATEAGVEGYISGHSLRVGSAVSLAEAGATVSRGTAGRAVARTYNASALCEGDAYGTESSGEV